VTKSSRKKGEIRRIRPMYRVPLQTFVQSNTVLLRGVLSKHCTSCAMGIVAKQN